MLTAPPQPVGELLRAWRQRRRLSQLDLASEAEISTRHLSFLETGRAQPSRDMVLRLAEQLDVPLRERNTLLISAGFAPILRFFTVCFWASTTTAKASCNSCEALPSTKVRASSA